MAQHDALRNALGELGNSASPSQRLIVQIVVSARNDYRLAKNLGYIGRDGTPRPARFKFRRRRGAGGGMKSASLAGGFNNSLSKQDLFELARFFEDGGGAERALEKLGIPPEQSRPVLQRLRSAEPIAATAEP